MFVSNPLYFYCHGLRLSVLYKETTYLLTYLITNYGVRKALIGLSLKRGQDQGY